MMDINTAILESIKEEFINSDELLARNEWETYAYDNIAVPRVSHILKACNLSIEPLMRWANNLGYRHTDYVQARNIAAEKGTRIHNAIEAFIKERKVPNYHDIYNDEIKHAVYNGFEGFVAFWNNYRYKNQIKEVKMEQTLVTPYFGGTYDLMITLKDGRNFLYDFKTTNSLKWEQFVQLSAYKFALENYYATNISAIGVLLIDKSKPSCKEYLLDLSIPSNQMYVTYCEQCFISMLNTFYNCTRTKEKFNDIRKDILIKGE